MRDVMVFYPTDSPIETTLKCALVRKRNEPIGKVTARGCAP